MDRDGAIIGCDIDIERNSTAGRSGSPRSTHLNIGAGFGDENLISRGGAMRAFAGTCVAAGWLVAGMRICVHSISSEESDVCVAGIISKLSSLSAGGMVGMSYLLR